MSQRHALADVCKYRKVLPLWPGALSHVHGHMTWEFEETAIDIRVALLHIKHTWCLGLL